jgi:hypothetical protein
MFAIGVVAALLYCLYSDKMVHMQQGDKMDKEWVTGDGDDRVEAFNNHEYIVLLFILTTL